MMNLRTLSRVCVGAAGLILLLETLFGMFAVLGIGFSMLLDVATDLCLTMAFPIYLVGFRSLAAATFGLCLLFIAQWVDMYLVSVPRHFGNMLNGWFGELLLLTILLMTFSYAATKRQVGTQQVLAFRDI
ncbi:hypothetical protein RBB77_08765 [Tunturibacter psychrotolerans]|uniref:Uncharacterized protein n=1 Tax=Tunturiibacter psychrotolerans TaxID=3069686 RepID=A0AAU7ZVA9_9BACT